MRGARHEASGAGSLLCVLAFAFATAGTAHAENPVSVSVASSAERIRIGESADLTVTIEIAGGWHINAREPGPSFLIPTTVELEMPAGVRVEEVRYPEPVRRRIALGGGTDLALYEKTVSFATRLHYETAVEAPREPVAVVRYQACTEELCLRPTVVRLPLPVELSALGGVTLAATDQSSAGAPAPRRGLTAAPASPARPPQAGAGRGWPGPLLGCILIAMAVYFRQPALSGRQARLAMPVIPISSIARLASSIRAASHASAATVLRGSVAAAAVLFIGAYPLMASAQAGLSFEPFTTHAYDRARASGRPFVVEFSAEWCKPCKEMEERTFADPEVIRKARGMTFLEVDMTDPDGYTEAILQSFNVKGAPTTVFFGSDGKEHVRRIGFLGPSDFLRLLGELRGESEPARPQEPSVVQGA